MSKTTRKTILRLVNAACPTLGMVGFMSLAGLGAFPLVLVGSLMFASMWAATGRI